MSDDLQTKLFEDDNIETITEYLTAIEKGKNEKNNSNSIILNNTPDASYQWVFQFGDNEPVPFFISYQNMINPNGDLVITCTPSNVTHLEFKQEEQTFKIYSKVIN